MSEDACTIFYSWQSQLPGKTNRNLIEDALKAAAKRLRSDPAVEELPEIDQGAAGTPGAKNIAEVILAKLEKASAVVFDVTIIPSQDSRPSPNANVLIELGYALRSVGQDRIVLVMNTANGPPEALPFDLRFRSVVTYLAGEGTSLAEVRKVLSSTLEGKLRTILELPPRNSPPVELDFSYKRMRMYTDASGYTHTHDYELRIRLTSKQRLAEWYIDVELPSPLYNAAGVINCAKVDRRSNGNTTFLRYETEKPLKAGDPYEVAVQYRVTDDIYRQHHGVLDQWTAKAVAYVDGEPVADRVLTKIQEF
jgi:hypothetical protein